MAARKRFDVVKMRKEFLAGSSTLRELARKYGCSYRYISGMSAQEKWYPQRAQLQQQAEQVASEALLRRVTEKSAELAQIKALTAEQHVERSLQTGEQLHQLLRQGLAALQSGDIRALKTAIDSWSTWDKTMRSNHQIEDKGVEKPLVNIAVMAALPPKAEMLRRRAEAEAV